MLALLFHRSIVQRRTCAGAVRKPRWRARLVGAFLASFFRVSVACPRRPPSAVRLSAPCQTRHWMMMTTMITIACSPAHRGATMRGGRRRAAAAPHRRGKKPRPLQRRAAPLHAVRRSGCPRRSDFPARQWRRQSFWAPLSFFTADSHLSPSPAALPLQDD